MIETANLKSLAAATDRGWNSSNIFEVARAQVNRTVQNLEQPPSSMEKNLDKLMGKMVEVMDHRARREDRTPTRKSRDRNQTPDGRREKNGRQR